MKKFSLRIVPYFVEDKVYFNFVLPSSNIIKTPEEVVEMFEALKSADLYDGPIPTVEDLLREARSARVAISES